MSHYKVINEQHNTIHVDHQIPNIFIQSIHYSFCLATFISRRSIRTIETLSLIASALHVVFTSCRANAPNLTFSPIVFPPQVRSDYGSTIILFSHQPSTTVRVKLCANARSSNGSVSTNCSSELRSIVLDDVQINEVISMPSLVRNVESFNQRRSPPRDQFTNIL